MKVFLIIITIIFIIFLIFYVINKKQTASFHLSIDKEIVMNEKNITKVNINPKALVIAKHEIIINASIDTIWNVLTSINNWSSWQTNVTKVKITTKPKEGTIFKWEADGLKFNSKIHTSVKNKCFGWIGTTFGSQAIHNWYFIEQKNSVKVVCEESLQGFIISAFPNYFQQNLSKAMIKNLNELRIACE